MSFASSIYMNDIRSAETSISFQDKWGAVTQPTATGNPNDSRLFGVSYVYAISSSSSNADAAWELLKAMVSKNQAQRDKRNHYSSLSAIPMTDNSEPDDVFFRMSSDPSVILSNAELEGSETYRLASGLIHEKLDATIDSVLAGTTTVEKALADLQKTALSGGKAVSP